MAKRKIVFLKPWGTYKVGDVIEDPSEVTVRTLCFTHNFGKLVGDPRLADRIAQEKKTMTDLQKDFEFELKGKQRQAEEAETKAFVEPGEKIDKSLEEIIGGVSETPAKKARKPSTKKKATRRKSRVKSK